MGLNTGNVSTDEMKEELEKNVDVESTENEMSNEKESE